MSYSYELLDGTTGELDSIIISNSIVIQNLLNSCDISKTIPLLNNYCTVDSIKNTKIILNYIVNSQQKDEAFLILDYDNLQEAIAILNFAEFCDIQLVREFMINHFARLIRTKNSVEELFELFN